LGMSVNRYFQISVIKVKNTDPIAPLILVGAGGAAIRLAREWALEPHPASENAFAGKPGS
uniref:hypothetical protein n=1 Tax=Pseudomonas asplenii TaxID=53407 RepID=UPI001E3C9110